MRILSLTNFYPPFEVGGEAQSCYDMTQALAVRGHEVLVLTSTHGVGRPVQEGLVWRQLPLEMELGVPGHPWRFFTRRRQREQEALNQMRQAVAGFSPDVLFLWAMWNLPRSLPALAEQLMPTRVLYRFGDYWPALPSQHELYWRTPGRNALARPLKRALGRLALAQLEGEKPLPTLRFPHAYCISAAMRQEMVNRGTPVAHARVIYNGLDPACFRPRLPQEPAPERADLALLYAGRVVPEKGVHTAIEAVILLAQRGIEDLELTVAGPAEPTYAAALRARVARAGLGQRIHFRGVVPQPQMPGLIRAFDALVFPSIWPEPFGRSLIEAMASELAVLCTPAGGVPEIVTDGHDGLYFAPADAASLATQIERLRRDPALRQRLGQAGRRTVLERFTLDRMTSQVESYLQEIAGD